MRTVRKGVFETNSSSTHSVTIMSAEDYKRWEDEMLYYNYYEDILLTKEEFYESIRKEYPEDSIEEIMKKAVNYSDFGKTFEEFHESDYLEVDVTNHTTKSGDEIVIICKYGNDY